MYVYVMRTPVRFPVYAAGTYDVETERFGGVLQIRSKAGSTPARVSG